MDGYLEDGRRRKEREIERDERRGAPEGLEEESIRGLRSQGAGERRTKVNGADQA